MAWRRQCGAQRRRSRAAPSRFLHDWAGFESDLIIGLDARLGIILETGVRTWEDQSDNGNDVEQTVLADQPAHVGGGQAYVDLDGTNDYLFTTSMTGWPSDQDVTIFCVHSMDDPTSYGPAMAYESYDSGSASVHAGYHVYDNGQTDPARGLLFRASQVWSGQAHSSSWATNDTTDRAFLTTIKSTGARTDSYVDGTLRTSVTTPTIVVPNQDTLHVGRNNGGGLFLNGRIYTFFVIGQALSDANRELIENRVKNRLGIA